MPFSIVCPECDARLQVPDALAGKRIKCKKCGGSFVVRRGADRDDGEEDERPTRAAAPKARRRADEEEDRPARPSANARRRDEDDRDEDRPRRRSRDENDEDDEPRRRSKKGKKKAAGSPAVLFALLGVGALVVIGGGIAAYVLLVGDKKPDGTGGPAGLPGAPGGGSPRVALAEEVSPDGTFSARFPSAPRQQSQTVQTPQGQVS